MSDDFSSGGEKIHLEPWEEIVGEFVDVEKNDDFVNVLLRSVGKVFRLEYPLDSDQAEILKSELESADKGVKVGILLTDIPETPVKIRVINEQSGDQ